MTVQIPDDAIRVSAAAELIGVTERHVRRLCERGTLVAVLYGRDWMVSKRSAVAYRAAPRHPGPRTVGRKG
jgi:hypothetical protein